MTPSAKLLLGPGSAFRLRRHWSGMTAVEVIGIEPRDQPAGKIADKGLVGSNGLRAWDIVARYAHTGAGDGDRTHDTQLGKLVLYH
jgi:hypothetical protein